MMSLISSDTGCRHFVKEMPTINLSFGLFAWFSALLIEDFQLLRYDLSAPSNFYSGGLDTRTDLL